MSKVIANAYRVRQVPNVVQGDGATVLAELVPTTVLLDRIPDTQRIGDYLLVNFHPVEHSVFDPKSWDGAYNDSRVSERFQRFY